MKQNTMYVVFDRGKYGPCFASKSLERAANWVRDVLVKDGDQVVGSVDLLPAYSITQVYCDD